MIKLLIMLTFVTACFTDLASPAAVTEWDDADYLMRLRKSLTSSDVILVGTIDIGTNTRLRASGLKDNGKEYFFSQDGQLTGTVTVKRLLKGAAKTGDPIWFAEGVYYVSGGTLLMFQLDWFIIGKQQLIQPRIWFFKSDKDGLVVSQNRLNSITADALPFVQRLLGDASADELHEDAIRLLKSESWELVVMGVRSVASLQKKGDLQRLEELLFHPNLAVRQSALFACERMMKESDENTLAQIGRDLQHVDNAEVAREAVTFLTEKTDARTPPTDEKDVAEFVRFGKWLETNWQAVKLK